jgi:hypothetical protein
MVLTSNNIGEFLERLGVLFWFKKKSTVKQIQFHHDLLYYRPVPKCSLSDPRAER